MDSEIHPVVAWLDRRSERDRKRRTLPWLATRLGWHKTTLYRLVKGERGVSMKLGQQLADYTGIPLDEIARRIPPTAELKARR